MSACPECGAAAIPADYFSRDELAWLEAAARRAATDKIAVFAKATDDLFELAAKLRKLRGEHA